MDKFFEALNMLLSMDKELIQIIGVTLKMSFFSTFISCLIGMPVGVILEKNRFRGRRFLKKTASTLMGLPPVVAGLIVYMLFTKYGIFGSLGLLFTVEVMVIAPVVVCLTGSVISVSGKSLLEASKGLALSKTKTLLLFIYHNRRALLSVLLTAFGRSIAEVGAVSLVGGNIQWKTRVMTTAILLETNKGKFTFALALGVVLLLISLIVNVGASVLIRGGENDDNL